MTPAQAGVASTYPVTISPTDTAAGVSSVTPPPELLAQLGGRFTGDLVDLLNKPPVQQPTPTEQSRPKQLDDTNYQHQVFALARLRGRNITGAIEYIERHTPDQLDWLHAQIQRFYPTYHPPAPTRTALVETIERVQHVAKALPEGTQVDPEAGRIAYLLGQFTVYRAWVFAHASDDGDGWVERKQLEALWQTVGVAKSKRHARRLLERGTLQAYWTQDKDTKRIYLCGQVNVTSGLVSEALYRGYHHLIATNKPGKRHVQVNLAGTLQEASANLYAAWLVAKDPERKGTTISRDLLCDLWQVSVPTLLEWEHIARIGKQANYAQSNDTALENVPEHAYLTLNRDGTQSPSWRLPNTYTVNNHSIQQHAHTGKATHIKQAVRGEIWLAEQRGSIGDAALPRSGKRYFTHDNTGRVDAFKACGDYLRKLSRKGGDVFQRRYFYVGSRHGVRIYEPYNIQTDVQETHILQRDLRRERRDPMFSHARYSFARRIADHARYLEALA